MIPVRSVAAARPRDPVADAISRLVGNATWSGTVPALFDAATCAATPDERAAAAWPATVTAFAVQLAGLTDALCANGLRVTRAPAGLAIERLLPVRGAA